MKYLNMLIIVLAVSGTFLQARYRPAVNTARSEKKFYNLVHKRNVPYAVAIFYQAEGERRHERGINPATQALLNKVAFLSNEFLYKEGDLRFIKVNTTHKDLANLEQQFNITRKPTCIIFKEGSPLRDKAGNIIKLSGDNASETLKKFIDKHLLEDLKRRVDIKAEARAIRAEQMAYYWYSPWWGYPYGYYPSWGFSANFYL
ncbi:MAG TPA: thioredoxin family protein [Candidatus Babeliales bacterium]|nr:thioredoxin family protein [Candidatus Babeliales bacterium]